MPSSRWRFPLVVTVLAVLILPGCVSPSPDGAGGPELVQGGQGGPPGTGHPEKDPEPTGAYSVHLRADASRGPLGPEPLTVDRRLFSTNLWYESGWYPKLNATWLGMLKAIQPGSLRWPSGHPSQHACWDPEDDGEPWPGCHGMLVSAKQLDAFVALNREVGSEPLFAINVKTGTPEMAADIVRYANVEKGYGIKYWHLGNEPDLGNDPQGLPAIIEAWPKFSRAMRAVDPKIQLVGPEIMTGAHVMGIHGRKDWMQPFLEANPGDVDAISWHLYPLDSDQASRTSGAYPSVEHLLQYAAPDWRVAGISFVDLVGAKLRQDREALMPGAEIWVTELGPDSGNTGAPGVTDGMAAAVWFADVLGRFADTDTDAVFQFAFDHWVPGQDELSLIQGRAQGYAPLPPWYTYWLYAQHWGVREVWSNSTHDARVSIHASLQEDGRLALVLVNKGPADATARLTLEGVTPVAHAEAWTLQAPSPSSLDATVNGQRLDPVDVAAGTAAIAPREGPATRDALMELPAYSVTFLVVTPEP